MHLLRLTLQKFNKLLPSKNSQVNLKKVYKIYLINVFTLNMIQFGSYRQMVSISYLCLSGNLSKYGLNEKCKAELQFFINQPKI